VQKKPTPPGNIFTKSTRNHGTPRSISEIQNRQCSTRNCPQMIIVDSPYSNGGSSHNKENVPPHSIGVPAYCDRAEGSGLSTKMTSLNISYEVPNRVSLKMNSSLSLSTDCIIGRRDQENLMNCLSPSRLSNDKTWLQVEAENIRRNTRLSPYKSKLEILKNTSQPELNCLCPTTVAKLVQGQFKELYELIVIIDCRFEYEYLGGHIKGALNFPKEDDIDKYFIKNNQYHKYGEKLCLVFHCEYSSHRGPKSYKRVRSSDRKLNEPNYPDLFYPEMYLLEGGYKQFYKDYPELCEPQGYVEMKDPCFIPEMRLGLQNRGRTKSQRRFFSQSCTNIFDELRNNKDNDEEIDTRRILKTQQLK